MPIGDPMGRGRFEERSLPIGGIHMAALPVRSIEASLAFYGDILDLPLLQRGDDWALLACGGQRLLLRESPAPGGDRGIYLSVPGIYEAHRQLVDRGAFVVQPPMGRDEGLVCAIEDDDGNLIRLIEGSASQVG